MAEATVEPFQTIEINDKIHIPGYLRGIRTRYETRYKYDAQKTSAPTRRGDQARSKALPHETKQTEQEERKNAGLRDGWTSSSSPVFSASVVGPHGG